ncbi:hypothetical protein ACFX58_10635 [Sphingomonas sp. NCPPB 2930]
MRFNSPGFASRAALALVLCGGSPWASATCYTVYGPGNAVIYRADRPPVDMRYPLHETVPKRFGPGTTMMFTLANDACLGIGSGEGSTGPTTGYLAQVADRDTISADALGVRRASRTSGSARSMGDVVTAPRTIRSSPNVRP